MLRNKKSYDLLRDCVSRLADHRILFPWFLLTGVKYNSNIKKRNGFSPYSFITQAGCSFLFLLL